VRKTNPIISYKTLLVSQTLLYNSLWVIAIVLSAKDLILAVVALSLIFISAQLYCCRLYCINLPKLIIFTILLCIVGFFVDSLLFYSDVFYFNACPYPIKLAPPFLNCIWLSFGITFYATLQSWFKRYLTTAAFSLVGFPLAYWAGIKLGAASAENTLIALLSLGLIWMFLLPTYLYLFNLWSDNANHPS